MALNTTSNQQDGGGNAVPTAGDDGSAAFERAWIEQETGQPVDPDEIEEAEEENDDDPQDELEAAEDEETEQEPQDEPELFEVNAGGKTLQVTKDELIKGYQRLSDYTRKTQEAAETRKEWESRIATVSEAEQHLLALLDRYDPQEQEPDWVELQRQDPLGWQETQAHWMNRQKEVRAAQAERQRILQERQANEQAERFQTVNREGQALLSKLIEAKGDRKKALELMNGALRHGQEAYGFSEQEMKDVVDHRVILALRDAQRYRQLAKAKPSAAAAINGAPKTVRPGQAGNASAALRDRVTAAKTAIRQTGDPHAFDQLLAHAYAAERR